LSGWPVPQFKYAIGSPVTHCQGPFGSGGIFATETRAALYDLPAGSRPGVLSYVAGLGGRDITPGDFKEICQLASSKKAPDEEIGWIGVKR
jgi:pyruvate/2-oxoacid:ferredoxin oxidoreductase alpha subunit